MEFTEFGRTGLKVSVIGLGCGGYSKLGTQTGGSKKDAVAVVKRARELGLTVFDTAEVYRTEEIVGEALQGEPREDLVICTKTGPRRKEGSLSPEQLREKLEQSLRNLRTDYVDIYQMHGVRPEDYERVAQELLPELLRLKEEGKIRLIGITEAFERDTTHETLGMAVRDEDSWDSMMVGFNLLNQTARKEIFPAQARLGFGILGMFAVRHALVNLENLRPVLEELAKKGEVPGELAEADEPLDFALAETEGGSLAEVAYRFVVHEPHVHTTLTGTGSIEHLEQNVAAALKGPLSSGTTEKLKMLFRGVRSESAKSPQSRW